MKTEPNHSLHNQNRDTLTKELFFDEVITRLKAIGILNWKPEVYRKDINRMWTNRKSISDAVSSLILRS